MEKMIRMLLIGFVAILATDCVNVDLETSLNSNGSGKGKLVYSWDSSRNLDYLSLDENFSTIAANPAINITVNREYDSDGKHYKEMEWTFKDINKVDLNGMTYSFKKSGDTATLQVLFSDEAMGIPEESGNSSSVQDQEAPSPMASDELLREPSPETVEETETATEGSPAGDGAPSMEEFPENVEMEEMFEVMTKAMLRGHRVKFQFTLPYEVMEAPGGKIDGRTATWEIPLIDLFIPTEESPRDDFRMVLKP
jgi:hypothetical protein